MVKKNPTTKVSFLSRLFFCWVGEIFSIGSRRQLEPDDFYELRNSDQSATLSRKLERSWMEERKRAEKTGSAPRLSVALIKTFWQSYAQLGILLLVEESSKIVQPLMIGGLLRNLGEVGTVEGAETRAYLYATGVAFCSVLLAVVHHPYFFQAMRIGMWLRVSCCNLIYKKVLRLDQFAMLQTSTGQIVNLMTNDVQRLDYCCLFLHFLWLGPLEAIAVLTILYQYVGLASVAGVAALLILSPIQVWIGKLFARLRSKTAKLTDERVKLTSEMIHGMRVVKLYCWENMFGRLITKIRKQELLRIGYAYLSNLIKLAQYMVLTKVAVLAVLWAGLVRGQLYSQNADNSEEKFTVATVFLCLAMFNSVKVSFAIFFPYAVQFGAESIISIGRIQVQSFVFIPDNAQLKHVRTCLMAHGGLQVLVAFGGKMIFFCVLCGLFLIEKEPRAVLRPSLIWPLVFILHILRGTVLSRTLTLTRYIGELRVTVDRVQRLLMLPELSKDSTSDVEKAASLEMVDFCASWNHEDQDSRVLSNINLKISEPELVAVVGSVGSGKSSLVMAILGELPAASGSLKVNGTTAYAAQQPWVFAATLRENVIFGREWDQQRYEDAINVSALRVDLERLPLGDQTVVGERGVALSGGQRARVGLARALYSGADIYLLDDPLSAVDAGVAKHLFNHCIRGHLKHKPRILITHQLQFLKSVDRIVVLKNGSIFATGTYSELVQKGIKLDMIVKTENTSEEGRENHTHSLTDISSSQLGLNQPVNGTRSGGERHKWLAPAGSCLSIDSVFTSSNAIDNLMELEPQEEEEEKEMGKEVAEARASGTLTWRVFYTYFLAGINGILLLPIVLLFMVCQSSYVLCDWWLAFWMKWERAFEEAHANGTAGTLNGSWTPIDADVPLVGKIDSTWSFLWILSAITMAVLVTSVFRSFGFYMFTLCASRRLHKSMLYRIIRAPSRFFDTNSAGRILNRFSKDTGVMDDMLPPALSDFWICSFMVAGNLIVNFVISPWTIVAVAPLGVCFVFLRRYYMKTSRNVKRLEAVARSPVFAHVNNTLLGLATVRSSHSDQLFARRFEELQDNHSRAWYVFLVTTRWFGIRLDWLCVCFVIAVSYLSIATAGVDDAKAGLMLTYAVGLLGMFQWCIRQSTEVENHMVSVERIVEYTRLEQEASFTSVSPPSESWPSRGDIEFTDVQFRYWPEGPLVLKDMSWRVPAGEKVGIVGRTGAGKSSLIVSLFRLSEVKSGSITIDGMDVGPPMGLHELRSKISIIPQDPVLFTGSVRWNLDPLSHQSDDTLWRALEDVQMKEFIKTMPHGLDSTIAEGGVNLSVGQRQLMCLARALLRRNRILMIDEATANVDPRTDELIQQTIRSKFAHCTVLTIAHRLHTIMDSDAIMVLDDGLVVEFDHPHVLLHNASSLFKIMVGQLDMREQVALRRVAESAYNAKKKEEDNNGVKEAETTQHADEEVEEKTALLNGIHPVV